MKRPTNFYLNNTTKSTSFLVTLKSILKAIAAQGTARFYISLIVMLCGVMSSAQLAVPFTPRLDGDNIKVKGDIVFIGNSVITGAGLPQPYNGTQNNNGLEGAYINAASGGDSNIFSSSSADLVLNNPCKRIVYAGLYWASVYPLEVANNPSVQFEGTPRLEDWNQIKFKVPGGEFVDLVADNEADPVGEEDDIIFDGYEYYGPGVENSFKDSPIICYKNVTGMLQGLTEAEGEYAVANLRATRGRRRGGCSAGWTLVIIYESPTMPSKYIALFDGYAGVQNTTELDIPVSGFQTLPAPYPVNANIAVGALEGDIGIRGDSFRFKSSTSTNYTVISDAINQSNNFFNSTITKNGVHNLDRNPASTNTLGLDINNVDIPNPSNMVLPNDATAGDLKLTTNGDGYGAFVTSFAVEIIEPDIVLTKIVEDEFGNNIGGQVINLGQELTYVIGFQNTGNDDATDLIIRDILPVNTILDYPAGLDLPAGVTIQSYDETTRELILAVDDDLVEEFDPVTEFRINVRVVETCAELIDACDDLIQNQAFASYRSVTNPSFIISDDPSINSNSGCLLSPQTTNFLADLDDCTSAEEVILCGTEVTITSGGGYDAYVWSTNPSGTPVIGTGQSLTVTESGTYYVQNIAIAPCQSSTKVFEVITYGEGVTNPLLPLADEVVICPNDGKELPNFFLCGTTDIRNIFTGITDTTSIIWEQLDESSCSAVANQDCANEDASCTWNEVGTGPDFIINASGQFRLTLNYDGGCFNQFYFNVYQNILNPTVTSRDIYCDTLGEITVGGVPSGYEYSIDGTNYQSSPVFSITSPGLYTIYLRQVGVTTNPCIFEAPEVQIRERDFTVSTAVEQPFCNNELGSIYIAANDVRPQYYFSISEGGTLVNTVGPIVENNYTFQNLSPGLYTVNVTTDDGCDYTEAIEIIQPPIIDVSAALTAPLNCTDGEVTIYVNGGTAPYFYFINGSSDFQTVNTFTVSTAGTYDISVVDANNCTADTSITVDAILPPEYNVLTTNDDCLGGTGVIEIDVTNAYGSSLLFSIDGGTNFTTSSVFNGLVAGDYEVVIQYSVDGDLCDTSSQTVSITAPDQIIADVALTTNYTCVTPGEITVSNITGGNPPFTYSIDGVNYQNSNTFGNLSPGDYTVWVQDSSGCAEGLSTVTIDPLDPPTNMDLSNSSILCPSNTITLQVDSVTGGTLPLEYQITSPTGYATAYQASNSFSGLLAGTYTVQVRDANSCTYAETYTIDPIPALAVTAQLDKALDCSPTPDAQISGTLSGGTAPFTYAVSFNGGAYSNLGTTATNFTYNATAEGNYQFEVTDANGCTATTELVVVSPLDPVTVSINAQDSNCNGDTNGVIELTGLTGQAPFEYSLDGGATFQATPVFGGLAAGSYNFVVVDALGCDASGSVVLNNPAPINATFNSNPIQCNSNVPGSIDITLASGGVAPFTYTILDTSFNQLNTFGTTSNTTHTFTGLDFGNYIITIVDANACEFVSDPIRIETPPNISLVANSSSGSCTTGASVDIEVISGAPPFTYAIFGQTGTEFGPTPSFTHTFSNLLHGVTYQLEVIDAGGCFSIIEVTTPDSPSGITVNASSPVDVTCFGGSNGSLDFTISNYDASVTSLSYEILDGLSNTPITPAVSGTINGVTGAPVSDTVTGLDAGFYTLLIREVDGTQCTTSLPFTVRQPAQDLVAAVASTIDANCNADAQMVINASGGTAPYSYAAGLTGFTPSAGDFSTSNVISLDPTLGLTWDVVVRDANDCEIRISETIGVAPSPEISLATVNNCIITEGAFEMTVNLVTAGVADYMLSINGSAYQSLTLPHTYSGLSSGTYTVSIRDTNGCVDSETITIDPPIALSPQIITNTTCNNDDGIIEMTTTGGSGSYVYSITPALPSISLVGNQFTGVPSGMYTITVDDPVNGCTASVEVLMPVAVTPIIGLTPLDVNCFADTNGGFELFVSNYAGAYTYEVFDSSSNSVLGPVAVNTATNPQLVTGLGSGTYEVVMVSTESPFCATSGNVVISSPPATLGLVLDQTSDVSCDDQGGSIVATASGGTAPYEFELSGPVNVAFSGETTFTNLPSGTYTVTVRDAQNCIASETIILTTPPAITADFNVFANPLLCFGDDNASIEVINVVGGQGSNYTYTLNTIQPIVSSSGPQTTPVFTNLAAGVYQVEITDGLNCVYQSNDITITEPSLVDASLVLSTNETCTLSASLTLSATGGTGMYSYSTDPSFTTVIGTFANAVTFDVSPGTYQYYVRDANGCIAAVSNELTVSPLPPLVVNLDVTNSTINCAGDATGAIVATAQGGLGNYVYTLQDTNGNDIAGAIQSSPGVFTELTAGSYIVYVTSGDCDETSVPVTITEPANPLTANAIVDNVTCSGSNNGVITIAATGGTGIIKYAISPRLDQFFDEPVFENLAPGNYEIIVQDELGCFEVLDVEVTEPAPVILSIVPDSIFPEVCTGDANGEFSISISGGTLPYSVSLDDPNGTYTTGGATQTEFDFTDLVGGDHMVYVIDSEGCASEWNITFPESVSLSPIVEVTYNCDDNTIGNTVVVTLEDETINATDVDYSLNGGPYQQSRVFKDVSAGENQFISVRHSNGCVQTSDAFTVDFIAPLQLSLQEGEINEILAIADGGSEIYEYYLNGESYGSTNSFIVYESGVYTVSVRDSFGCEVSATISIEYIDVCIPNYFTPGKGGELDTWGPGCSTQYQNLTVDIFDRYGRKIAELRGQNRWDGTYEGNELPSGDYWYVVKLNDVNDDRNFVGHFTLYR